MIRTLLESVQSPTTFYIAGMEHTVVLSSLFYAIFFFKFSFHMFSLKKLLFGPSENNLHRKVTREKSHASAFSREADTDNVDKTKGRNV